MSYDAALKAEARRQAFLDDVDDPRHGTVNGYQNLGCRCDVCREANTGAMADYMARNAEQREIHRLHSAAAYRRRVGVRLHSHVPANPHGRRDSLLKHLAHDHGVFDAELYRAQHDELTRRHGGLHVLR